MKKFFIPLSCFFILFAIQSHAVLDVADKTKVKTDDTGYWLQKAIEQGSAEAPSLLSRIFVASGKKSLDAGKRREANGFFKQVLQLGDKNALFSIADIYLDREENLKASKWFEKLAKLGHVEAFAELGHLYLDMKEELKAIEWYKKAAEKGNKFAFFWIGYTYLKIGKELEAIEWLEKVATEKENGAVLSRVAFRVGHIYFERGEESKAKEWFERVEKIRGGLEFEAAQAKLKEIKRNACRSRFANAN